MNILSIRNLVIFLIAWLTLVSLLNAQRTDRIVLPQVVFGDNWTAEVRLINLAQDTYAARLHLVDSEGRAAAGVPYERSDGGIGYTDPDGIATVSVGSDRSLFLKFPPREQSPYEPGENFVGYIYLDVGDSELFRVSVVLGYHPSGQEGPVVSQVGVFGSDVFQHAAAPYSEASTAVALVNPGNSSLTVLVNLSVEAEDDGHYTLSTSVDLGPWEHKAVFLKELFDVEILMGKVDFSPSPFSDKTLGLAVQVLDFWEGKVSSIPCHLIALPNGQDRLWN